jgi:LPXTG-motif cell wall-anchored protein
MADILSWFGGEGGTWILIIGGVLLVALIVVFFILRSRRPED